MTLYQRQSRRGLIVVFIFRFKIYRKDLCKSLRVGVSFLIKLTEQSFISYYRLQLYNKRSQHGLFPANFEKLLRFLPEHPLANTFVTFTTTTAFFKILPLLSKQLQYFSCSVAAVSLAQPYENNNHLTF